MTETNETEAAKKKKRKTARPRRAPKPAPDPEPESSPEPEAQPPVKPSRTPVPQPERRSEPTRRPAGPPKVDPNAPVDPHPPVEPAGKGRARRVKTSRKQYWVGLTQDAPQHHMGLGSISFSRYTESVSVDAGDRTQRNRRIGGIERLTDKQVEEIKDMARNKVFRYLTPEKRIEETVELLNVNDPRFMDEPELDVPVGDFMWLIPLDSLSNPMALEAEPKERLSDIL